MIALLWAGAAVLLALSVYRASSLEDVLGRAFCAALLTVLIIASTSLGLARLGLFSLPAVTVFCLLGAGVAWRSPSKTAGAGLANADKAVLTFVLAFGALNFCFPVYYLLGGRDFGPYLLFSEHIATTGGLDLDLAWMRDVRERWGPPEPQGVVALDYPALYSLQRTGLGVDPAEIAPQFQHLWPALGANAYSVAGFEGLVRVNAVIGALALWAVYMFTRSLMGGWPALLVAILVGTNPAVVWAARISLTEALSLGLTFGGAYLLVEGLRAHSRWMAVLAGVALGAAVAARLDATFVVAWLIGSAFAFPEARLCVRSATFAYLLVASAALTDCWYGSTPYWNDLWDAGQLDKLVGLTFGGAGFAVAMTFVPERFVSHRVAGGLLRGVCFLVAFAMLGWLAYGLTYRPVVETGFPSRAMVELGFYLTPMGLILGWLGGLLRLSRPDWREWLPVLVFGIGTWFAFTWRPSITQDHIWASRRWVPAVIPAVTILAVGLLPWIAERSRSAAASMAAVGVVLWGNFHAPALTPFLFRSIGQELPSDLAHLSAVLEERRAPGEVVVTDQIHWASFLTYTFDVPTVIRRGELDETALAALDGTLFVTGEVSNDPADLDYLDRPTIEVLRPETLIPVVAGRAEKLLTVPKRLAVGRLRSKRVVDPRVRSIPAALLAAPLGEREHGAIRSTGEAGTVQNGPWLPLQAGAYVVEWHGEVRTPGTVQLDVPSAGGRMRHATLITRLDISNAGAFAGLGFTLSEGVEDIEFRLIDRTGLDLSISHLVVKRIHP